MSYESPSYRTLCQILAGRADPVAWGAMKPSDFEELWTLARREGVLPLLYYLLMRSDTWHLLPRESREQLTRVYYATAARNTLVYQELARILTALGNEDITPVVVLKGAALALTLYPSVALRSFGDIDLLLPRDHIDAATRAMRSLGYVEPYPEMGHGLDRLSQHVHLRGGPRDGVAVELHWSLVAGDADWRAPPLEWFWQQTEPLVLNERDRGAAHAQHVQRGRWPDLRVFTPTAHLLYLAAHLMLQHGGAQARLLWFYDLHLLVEKCGERIDWDALLRQAQAFPWTAALYMALKGAQERLDTPIPDGFLDRLAEIDDPKVAHLVRRKAAPLQTRATSVWDRLASLSWQARGRFIWGLLCPRPAYMRWRYAPRPSWLWPLYYPYRWLDIAREGVITLWKKARLS
ncbi:MAG TPA: nucleotidyltransferase family protein [Caldilineae bacterium]|nr:nucleotidyltransferase family protein [Caldilineae bacterium]